LDQVAFDCGSSLGSSPSAGNHLDAPAEQRGELSLEPGTFYQPNPGVEVGKEVDVAV
jgi:hypothetical protein